MVDRLLHQNAFALRELNCVLSGKCKGFTFSELGFEFDYKKKFMLKLFIQIHQTLKTS